MKDLCQSYLPYSPWDNIATSRLPGIQPLENMKCYLSKMRLLMPKCLIEII
ncbi:MAG: hypothetical protein CM15mP50_3270 [Rhodobacterales bacterium]|nr:MAG: hypothetical protein CM15mP50_3270 [Rhodobacterales bacterium]